jgi:SAM-dependent methyltransferase
VAAASGANVVACDLSAAIDVCREITAVHGEKVECIQASLLEMPFRKDAFDGIYCMGVIQHTPDPAKVMSTLPTHLKPGGRLVYNFYEESIWRRMQLIKYGIRLFTRRMHVENTLALSQWLVRVLFPLTASLSRIPKVRILNHFMPIAASHQPTLTREQQYSWTVLDTFDWYSPRYELCQRHRRVRSLLEALGLEDVDSRPGLAWGTRPET